MLATLADALPVSAEWSYEVKWDGYRTIAVKNGDRVVLYSRNLKDATKRYPTMPSAMSRLSVDSVVLDGDFAFLRRWIRPKSRNEAACGVSVSKNEVADRRKEAYPTRLARWITGSRECG